MERAASIPGVHATVAAIPTDNDELHDVLRAASWPVFQGHPDDVLARYVDVASATAADVIVRVTGDCPLLNAAVGGAVVKLRAQLDAPFASNDTRVSGFPDGWDVEVFTRDALIQAATHATDPMDREHVTPWMRRHLACGILYAPVDWPWPKVSVDTPEDLDRVRALMGEVAA